MVVPAVESLLVVAVVPVVAVAPAARVVVGRVVDVPVLVLDARVDVLGLEMLEPALPGMRAAAVVPPTLFSTVLPGLESKVLLRRLVVDFFSSSLALTLGRLRWLVVVEAVPGLRAAVVVVDPAGGRVGGLVKPPVALVPVVVPVGLVVVVVVAVRRAVAVVVVLPGRFAVVVVAFAVPLAGAGASDDAAGPASAGVEVATGAASSGWTTSKLSFSDMMSHGGRAQLAVLQHKFVSQLYFQST